MEELNKDQLALVYDALTRLDPSSLYETLDGDRRFELLAAFDRLRVELFERWMIATGRR